MRSDHAFLESCRRCPVGSGFADLEAPYRDVVAASLGGEEAHSSDVDLGHLGVRFEAAEVSVDDGLVAFLFCVPLVFRLLGNP